MVGNRIKLYLDTSVPSAFFDTSKPMRQLISQKWFENKASLHDLFISVTTIEEIDRLANTTKRQNIKDLLIEHEVAILSVSDEALRLAQRYIEKGAIPESEPEDALHIALASANRLDAVASWNFKHIVSVNPIRKVHEINQKLGFPIIEIGTLQLFGGAEYGNL
jgi:predicted nucleic acid-binding protein